MGNSRVNACPLASAISRVNHASSGMRLNIARAPVLVSMLAWKWAWVWTSLFSVSSAYKKIFIFVTLDKLSATWYNRSMDSAQQNEKNGQFVKGNSARTVDKEAKGKKISVTSDLKHYLERNPDKVRGLVRKMVAQGIAGNMMATKEIFDRVDGKVAEHHILENTMPVQLIFMPASQLQTQGQIIEAEVKELTEGNSEGDVNAQT